MKRTHLQFRFGAAFAMFLIAAIVVTSCSDERDHEVGEPVPVLRSYSIAPELGPELTSILNEILDRGEGVPPAGRVELGPNGRLLVAAPEAVHHGIEKIVAEIDETPPEPAPSISITYWIVTGSPAEESSWSPRLDILDTVFEAISSADGPTRFALLEKVKLHSRSGERASAETRHYWVEQRATSRAGGVLADLNLDGKSGIGRVKTRVNLDPGKTLVLGQSALSDTFEQGPSDSSVYFIVRARVEPDTTS